MNNQNQGQNLIAEAEELLKEVKQANSEFVQKTDKLIKDINIGIKRLKKMSKSLSLKELRKIEKEAIKEMDRTVVNYVAALEELDESEEEEL